MSIAVTIVVLSLSQLDPHVSVMQTTKDRTADDATNRFDRARDRRILVQGKVRARLIVVIEIRSQQMREVSFAKDNHVINAFPPDRPDQPLLSLSEMSSGWRETTNRVILSLDVGRLQAAVVAAHRIVQNERAALDRQADCFEKLARSPAGAPFTRRPAAGSKKS